MSDLEDKEYKSLVVKTENKIQEKREQNYPFDDIDDELSYLSLLKRYKKVVPRK